ncbi:MAG: redoxin domain-containing protein [Candidatus Lightella neohaematopini]|nr:redoxin domain-containing protein [Candidatus Lightella neohaematopini]MCV2531262.1 redoxin domain-containing protein [Candidatus Lightella neohaematopini]
MMLVTKVAPNFTAPAVLKDGTIIDNFNLYEYISNRYAVIFFWPMDFTFVCPSEIISFNKRYVEFKQRDVKVIGISIDSVFTHNAWRSTSINNGGIFNINYPMISDIKRDIIKSYKVEHPELGVALRATFILDKDSIIRHQSINDLPVGRNIDEIIRLIDAFKCHEINGQVCPAQWQIGKDTIKPTKDGIATYLSNNTNDL